MQFAASAPDDVPARHGEHDNALPAAYVPSSHGFCSLDPSHEYPDGHSSQPVRDIEFPPEVNDPAGHVLQPLEPSLLLYSLSLPHWVHELEPATA